MALMRCVSSFAATVKGRPHVVNVGQLIEDTDPLYVGRERHFETASATAGNPPRVEQATAAPGERRTTSRPRKTKGGETDA
ncbi:hypothetical protein SAMN04487905_10627 [Actinopolyspora xinjiangensis]|uniref:Uncharacterized protein n=1 Tax=Actinopolyspora xinjiangensis TaxID=405564 RepID=A0A1H0U421_9ACTN|nr:hypothetical protein [Actinopolyspora xinjiangensis]SDP60800.1 hypothetical protein SAMN04487905_10627 [Actinopolyspora xinjiangensis]